LMSAELRMPRKRHQTRHLTTHEREEHVHHDDGGAERPHESDEDEEKEVRGHP